jgi:hypothetical protein
VGSGGVLTISSAIKRLRALEDQHGGHIEVKMIDTYGDVVNDDETVIDVRSPGTGKVCAIMSQMYWETIAPKGIQYKQE